MAPYFECDGVELRETSGEMNSILGNGKLVVSPAEQEQGNLLQAVVAGLTNPGAPKEANISVGNVLTFPLVTSTTQKAFKVIDTRTISFATSDYMTQYYITFPKGTNTAVVEEFTRVLDALAEGRDPRATAADKLTPYPSVPSATNPSAPVVAAAGTGAGAAPSAPAPAAASAPAASAAPAAAAPAQPTDSFQSDAAPPAAPKGDAGGTSVKQVTDLMGALWNAGTGFVAKAGEEMRKKAAEDTKTLQQMGAAVGQRAQQDTKVLMDAMAGKGQKKPSA